MFKLARILLVSLCLISTLEAQNIPKYTGGSPHNPKFVKRHIKKYIRKQKRARQQAISNRQFH